MRTLEEVKHDLLTVDLFLQGFKRNENAGYNTLKPSVQIRLQLMLENYKRNLQEEFRKINAGIVQW